MKARNNAIAEKKLTPEAFDKDAEATPPEFYANLANDLSLALAALESLSEKCNEQMQGESPSFGKLRGALEDLQSFVGPLVKNKKGEVAQEVSQFATDLPAAVAVPAPERKPVISSEPLNAEDAVRQIIATANALRRLEPSRPESYLILRACQSGELLAKHSARSDADLVPPASETLVLLASALCVEWSDRPFPVDQLRRRLYSGYANLLAGAVAQRGPRAVGN